MDNIDVLVAGIGPAGACAAWAAARAGLKVIAVERKRRVGEPVQCAELIPRALARWAQGAVVQPLPAMETVLPSGRAYTAAMESLMIDRAEFDRRLAARAEAAGAVLSLQTRLTGLAAGDALAVVEHGGRRRIIRYRALIAADGPASRVARALGLPRLAAITTRQYTVPLSRRESRACFWLSHHYPGGYAWLLPKGEVANLGVGMDKGAASGLKRPLESLHRRLIAEGRIGSRILSRTGGYAPVSGLRSRLVVGNVLFAGDAGGFTHPVSGAGIAAAVISGEAAGQAAADWLARGTADALPQFDAEMRDHFGDALARALRRRRQLKTGLAAGEVGEPTWRESWVAFSDYYRDDQEGFDNGA